MHAYMKQVASHMKDFGYHMLGKAIYDATFSEQLKPFAHALSVVHAAHGAEIVLKAKIANEHPLLVFTSLPKSGTTNGALTIEELFYEGRTYTYRELPEILWAATGYKMPEERLRQYIEFGRLRNGLLHFTPIEGDYSRETLRFLFEVMDLVVCDIWGDSFVRYCEYWDTEIIEEGYLAEVLENLKVKTHEDTGTLISRMRDSSEQ